MQQRKRQAKFSAAAIKALKKHKNTIGVAPTGAGKTVMLAAVVDQCPGDTSVVLQHRDELVSQNEETFRRYTRGERKTSFFDGSQKAWSDNTFAMVQTVAQNLSSVPSVDVLAIDEAHHCVSPSYLRVIDAFRKANPGLLVYGTTATSQRGDGKRLTAVFDNCCDQITIGELIQEGHLVRPRCFVVDLGVQKQLAGVRRTTSDFDMAEVESIMDRRVLNERIVAEWKERAGDRQTVVFCSTVDHAIHVGDAFSNAGVTAAVISDRTPKGERKKLLAAFDQSNIQVVINVAVLTEGWDCQPASCAILLRPSSFKSTMIQMIGRVLRKVDPERYPGVQKDDAIVLDFGTSILTHGDLEDEVYTGPGGTKKCTQCSSTVPKQSKDCPLCGYVWPTDAEYVKECPACSEQNPIGAQTCKACDYVFSESEDPIELEKFTLTEVDILNTSPFRYTEMMSGLCLMATAFTAWACVLSFHGRFVAIGGRRTEKGRAIFVLGNTSERVLAVQSADDFLLEHGDRSGARKSKQWMKQQPTPKQMEMLGLPRSQAFMVNKYEASCLLEFKFNSAAIQKRLEQLGLNAQAA